MQSLPGRQKCLEARRFAPGASPTRGWVLTCFLAAASQAASPATRPATPASNATRPAATQPGLARFQPGIWIHWRELQIEVEVSVILRDAPIELFACSPGNREHEAVVRIEARPMHLYQALGLIGLTPGRPMRSDESGQIIPATGDAVDLDIECKVDGVPRREAIEAWMRHAESDEPLGRLPWVFAGSLPLESRTGIASDVEGTVVAVVDFPTSLIALTEHHSDSNDQLWLRPNTARIPPIGTTARMIIYASPLRVQLASDGRLRLKDRSIQRSELARLISRELPERSKLRVELTVEAGVDPLDEKSLTALLRGLLPDEGSLKVLRTSSAKRPIIR